METNYKKVLTVDEIKKYLFDSDIVAFDYETAPDDPYRNEEKAALDPHKSHIVGCSFSKEVGTGIYVPVKHKVGKNIDESEFYTFLREFLTSKNIEKVAHNLSFESMFSYKSDIVIVPPVYDTILASQLTQVDNYNFRPLNLSGLKTLAKTLLDEPIPTFEDVTKGKFFDELDSDDINTIRYGCADSDFALRLYYLFNEWFDSYLPKHKTLLKDVESPTAVYLGIMKYNGIPLDIDLMKNKQDHATKEMERLKNEIKFIIGDIDIGSNCQTLAFKNYLFKDLKLPIVKTTEKNKEAADDMTMVLLKEWCEKNRPELTSLFSLVQEYRKWQKIKSTYIDGYLKFLNDKTNRLHPEIYSLQTETGRMNCRNPNVQNCPRKDNDPIGVRNFIKAPDGYLILSLDFSQIELRVCAYYSNDENMTKTYMENGDIHAMTTSVIYGISYEEAKDKSMPHYKERRSIAKNTNFGMAYSIFATGLQRTLKFKAGINKTKEECEEILENLKDGYPGLVKWQENTKYEAKRKVYIETKCGHRRYLKDILSTDFSKRSFAERCALNTPIQGTAAEILKMAIVRIVNGLSNHKYIKPILQIHDELVFIVPTDKVDSAITFIKSCMEVKPFSDFNIPLIAECSYGDTFGNMKE